MSVPRNNEENLLLCKRRIKITNNGVNESFPALDSRWSLKIKFESYVCLMSAYGVIKTGTALEEWQYKAKHLQNNFELLLALRHNEFWSTMLYYNDAISAIVKFLQRATPFYRLVADSESEQDLVANHAMRQYEQLLALVVRVIFRLLTCHESEEDWLTPEQHAGFLYNNFLISVPMLFDLTVALGNSNPKNVMLLKKLFASVLDVQPKYQMDIQFGLKSFQTIFAKIQAQVDNEGFESAGVAFPADDAQTPYDDVVLFTLDCAYTLSTLWDVCPQTMLYCAESKLPQSIAQFYDNTLPLLYKYIHIVNPNANSLVWLNEARQKFLDAFRSMVTIFLENLLTSPSSTAKSEHSLVALLTECLSAQSFVVDYQRQYPVRHDMELLQQACERLKDHKIEFIISGYEKAVAADPAGTMGDYYFRNYLRDHSTDSDEEATVQPAALNATVDNKPVDVRDIDLDVSKVLDVLPDLGIGFIRRLLERYDNSEEAIAAILDNNLPPDLMNSDRHEVYIPPDPQDQMYQKTGLSHINVHDGDAFDVMTQDEPKCIIKIGKGFPGAAVNAEQLLDDKAEVKELKERYQQYSLVEEIIDEYDDEYDDSYDAMIEGQPQPLHKTKELKSALSEASSRISESEDSDDNTIRDDDKQSTQHRDKRNDFCENPEDVRARYMARQQAKRGQKGWQQPSRDVVGAAKGQGQSKETLRNREQKEANKSTRANHNRKSGAAFKRSRGMIP